MVTRLTGFKKNPQGRVDSYLLVLFAVTGVDGRGKPSRDSSGENSRIDQQLV